MSHGGGGGDDDDVRRRLMYVAAETDAQRVLGIIPPPSQSTVRDVRTAFRRAARGAHPDRPGGDSARFASLANQKL